MEILQVVGLGLIATFLILLVKEGKPGPSGILISVVVGAIVFFLVLPKISTVISFLEDLATKANVDMVFMTTIFKIIGIAYIAEFGSQICKDAGEGAIANKIEFAAKVIIMVMAIPIMAAILEAIMRLLP